MEFPRLWFFWRTVLFLLPFALALAVPFGICSDKGSAVNSVPERFDGPAELPRVSMKSSLADSPAPGKTWKLKPGDDFQAALNRAACGDIIALEAGAVFTGNFTLPAKNCDDNHWIVVRADAPDAALPPEGTRLTPCFSGVDSLAGRPALNCASIKPVTACLMAVKVGPITLAPGANHYRIGPGLEITRPVGTGINYALIGKEANVAADHIIVDRDWVHGTAQDETTRGIFLSGVTYAAVVDSFFTDFHCTAGIGGCTDSQAIAGGTGTLLQGIWRIENNFLEAAAENILFGGARGTAVPTDIEIRHNHLFKPLTWMQGQPGFVGGINPDPTRCVRFNTPGYCPFVVKNLFELKNAQRVLVEGNIFEYTWPGFTQHGGAVAFIAMSSGGFVEPSTTVADITFRYNRVSHAATGLTMGIVGLGQSTWPNPKFAGRFSVHDDIFDDLSPAYYNGDTAPNVVGLAFQMSQCGTCAPLQDVTIDHVTMLLQHPKRFMVLGAPENNPIQGVTFINNIVSTTSDSPITGTGPKAPCGFRGRSPSELIANCISSPHFEANALVGGHESWPRGNFFPRNLNDVKFVNPNEGNGGDYHLNYASPYKHAGTDRKDLGADVDAVENATAGVL